VPFQGQKKPTPERDGEQVVAQGYELSRRCVSGELNWQERVLVVRSQTYADTQGRHLEERLAKAQEALLALTPAVGRGKRQITEEAALQSAAEAVLAKHSSCVMLHSLSYPPSSCKCSYSGYCIPC
jgi:transposase